MSTGKNQQQQQQQLSAIEAAVTIYRRYDDGYVVRSMTSADVDIVNRWWCGVGAIMPRDDLDIALRSFPASARGFYIGVIDDRVVASFTALPWGDDICYGSVYFVDESVRGRGFGTRLRDEVAFADVGSRTFCMDTVLGKVADTNRDKFGYRNVFTMSRYIWTVDDDKMAAVKGGHTFTLLPATAVDFKQLIDYDNKCFVSRDFAPRRQFLRRWISISDGASYVAVDDVNGHVIGLGCRRPAIQAKNHQIGPLYADNSEIAESLLTILCSHVIGDVVIINMWPSNGEALSLIEKFRFRRLDFVHQHIHAEPTDERKPTVYAVTSAYICGY